MKEKNTYIVKEEIWLIAFLVLLCPDFYNFLGVWWWISTFDGESVKSNVISLGFRIATLKV